MIQTLVKDEPLLLILQAFAPKYLNMLMFLLYRCVELLEVCCSCTAFLSHPTLQKESRNSPISESCQFFFALRQKLWSTSKASKSSTIFVLVCVKNFSFIISFARSRPFVTSLKPPQRRSHSWATRSRRVFAWNVPWLVCVCVRARNRVFVGLPGAPPNSPIIFNLNFSHSKADGNPQQYG